LVDRAAIKRLLDSYARLEGIVGLSPHTLRHTFATRYLAVNPDDLRGLAALLGHRNLNTVMIYTEPTRESLAERVERMS
jgi:site-specific recombinase XerD